MLLASPFSTVVCCWLLFPEAFGVVHVETVLVEVVVLELAPLLMPTDWEDDPDWEVIKDLNVGVTVADGLVDARVLALLVSFNGLIGVVVVDAPHVVIPVRRADLDDNPEDALDNGFVVDNSFDVFEDDVLEFEICEEC